MIRLAGQQNILTVLAVARRDWLILVLVAASLAPIWLFRYIPTQDGPAHLYNSHILRQYLNPDYNFQQFYNLRATLFPNWIAHALLGLSMFLFPPLIAEKVVISLYVILFPLAIAYLLEAVDPVPVLDGLLLLRIRVAGICGCHRLLVDPERCIELAECIGYQWAPGHPVFLPPGSVCICRFRHPVLGCACFA